MVQCDTRYQLSGVLSQPFAPETLVLDPDEVIVYEAASTQNLQLAHDPGRKQQRNDYRVQKDSFETPDDARYQESFLLLAKSDPPTSTSEVSNTDYNSPGQISSQRLIPLGHSQPSQHMDVWNSCVHTQELFESGNIVDARGVEDILQELFPECSNTATSPGDGIGVGMRRQQKERFLCKQAGCATSFSRKIDLHRHEQTVSTFFYLALEY